MVKLMCSTLSRPSRSAGRGRTGAIAVTGTASRRVWGAERIFWSGRNTWCQKSTSASRLLVVDSSSLFPVMPVNVLLISLNLCQVVQEEGFLRLHGFFYGIVILFFGICNAYPVLTKFVHACKRSFVILRSSSSNVVELVGNKVMISSPKAPSKYGGWIEVEGRYANSYR